MALRSFIDTEAKSIVQCHRKVLKTSVLLWNAETKGNNISASNLYEIEDNPPFDSLKACLGQWESSVMDATVA